jgi:hypothetical protein
MVRRSRVNGDDNDVDDAARGALNRAASGGMVRTSDLSKRFKQPQVFLMNWPKSDQRCELIAMRRSKARRTEMALPPVLMKE